MEPPKFNFGTIVGKPRRDYGHPAPLKDYVSGQPYVTFTSRGWLKDYRYGNPYREFTVQGPNGPYTDCVYDGLFADIDEQVRTSIRLVEHDRSPVIKATFSGVEVAGHARVDYLESVLSGFIAETLLARGSNSHPSFIHEPDRTPDDLELMYPNVTKPLKIKGVYPDWVWDAVAVQFPKYAEINRPKAKVKRPYFNVGTIGHINYPTISVKPRSFKNFPD